MSQIDDFAFEDIMQEAVKLFGHDGGMESCTNIEELTENVGDEQIERIVESLDSQ